MRNSHSIKRQMSLRILPSERFLIQHSRVLKGKPIAQVKGSINADRQIGDKRAIQWKMRRGIYMWPQAQMLSRYGFGFCPSERGLLQHAHVLRGKPIAQINPRLIDKPIVQIIPCVVSQKRPASVGHFKSLESQDHDRTLTETRPSTHT